MNTHNQNESPIFFVSEDDPEMEAAIKRARKTFRYFWREVAWEQRRIIPGLDLACVKVAFTDPPGQGSEDAGAEQMWVSDVNFDGKLISGTLINQPEWLTSVSQGDDVEVTPGRVSDWMYAIHERVYGAFTVNLLRGRMGRGERSQHDAAWGLDFGDPQHILVVPPEYIGEKPKGGFFSRLLGGGKQEPQDLKKVAAMEHPMALNMGESLEEFIRNDPTNVTGADDRGFTLLHQLALAGAAGGVAILLKNGADPNAVTNNGMTPLQLAKSLGWNKVIKTLQSHQQQG